MCQYILQLVGSLAYEIAELTGLTVKVVDAIDTIGISI